MKNLNTKKNQTTVKTENKGQATKTNKDKGCKLFLSLAKVDNKVSAGATLKNKNKFASDNVLNRAYALVSDVITKEGLTTSNAFQTMQAKYKAQPLDVNSKDIKRPQRVLASLCCKASGATRSTSSLQQDIKALSIPRNRKAILGAYPTMKDEVLNVVFKAIMLPSRTKEIK